MNDRERELYCAILDVLSKHNATRIEIIRLLINLNEPTISNMIYRYEQGLLNKKYRDATE